MQINESHICGCVLFRLLCSWCVRLFGRVVVVVVVTRTIWKIINLTSLCVRTTAKSRVPHGRVGDNWNFMKQSSSTDAAQPNHFRQSNSLTTLLHNNITNPHPLRLHGFCVRVKVWKKSWDFNKRSIFRNRNKLWLLSLESNRIETSKLHEQNGTFNWTRICQTE